HGGFYWSLDYTGKVTSTKKQVYAQGFVIYALSAYYLLTGEPQALKQALDCFELLEANCIDREGEGYFEAYTREWGKIEDVRLSEKDLNYPKTMNTHLHVLEAYTTLYKVSGDSRVAEALRYGIDLFDRYMINHDTGHLRMFMDDNWQDHSPGLTYGHDIECAWLLYKALNALGDQALLQKHRSTIIQISEVCLQEAIGSHGQVIDGLDFATGHVHSQSVWWVQAEALVGFLTAHALTDDQRFWQAAQNIWAFIYQYQLNHQQGEWLWHSTLDEPDGDRDYKVGFWKGPYHNGRAMIEAARLLAV
ncbi:MAG TPA: AGE family epimerase/isomerase, partial [Cellvibrionaceae bacterium]